LRTGVGQEFLEPDRCNGILVPFLPNPARAAVEQVMEERAKIRDITLAEVRLDDGQRLLAFNDFLLGDPESHFRAVADHMWPRI
jgi:hypothetical protein